MSFAFITLRNGSSVSVYPSSVMGDGFFSRQFFPFLSGTKDQKYLTGISLPMTLFRCSKFYSLESIRMRKIQLRENHFVSTSLSFYLALCIFVCPCTLLFFVGMSIPSLSTFSSIFPFLLPHLLITQAYLGDTADSVPDHHN